jgi:hypothetical protein
MILTARLPDLGDIAYWQLPSGGAHGLDIDHSRHRLYAACDDGPPDVTFFNPATGRVHVAIGEPGLIETIDPRTGGAFRPRQELERTRLRSCHPTGST